MSAKKIYRIEAFTDVPGRGDPGAERHRELMAELRALRGLISPTTELSEKGIEMMRREHEEARKIKVELDTIYEAIDKTKREIATLHVSGCNGREIGRVTDELDAVVFGTESATEQILSAAEAIDTAAGNLSRSLTGYEQELASGIQDTVVQVFEACNFQDLTGQRITKVVNTLRFVEERIVRMMEIWGGIESFKDIEVELEHRMGDQALLNGPALGTDMDIASQDDIDALFA
jgi:chemotaxis protein CheZ